LVVEKELVYETVYKHREGAAPPAGYLSPAEIAAKILAKEEEIMGKVAKEMAAREVSLAGALRRVELFLVLYEGGGGGGSPCT
jgi:hypothetical protein